MAEVKRTPDAIPGPPGPIGPPGPDTADALAVFADELAERLEGSVVVDGAPANQGLEFVIVAGELDRILWNGVEL